MSLTLRNLIEKGEDFKFDKNGKELSLSNFPMHYTLFDQSAQNKYIKWSELTERYLRANYPEEVNRFEIAKKDMYTLHGLNKLISILGAIEKIPQRIKESNSKHTISGGTKIEINNHNNQLQSQEQTQSQKISQEVFLDAIKDELDEDQLNEMKNILEGYIKGDKGSKRKLLDKLSSFGTNVLAGVVGNILTNPAMVGLL